MSAPPLLLLTAALLAGDVPYAERVERLRPFFSPPPGGEIVLDERELRDLGRTHKVAPGRLRGWIKVTPPKGRCLTLSRPGLADEAVCKPRQLPFAMDDLDKAGWLRWGVTTGDGDFGTELAWRSRYRVAVVTPFDKSLDDPPEYRYVGACSATTSAAAGRRLSVRLLTGEVWVLRLPDIDAQVPQPEPIPNLFISVSGGKMTLKDAEEDKKAERAEKQATEGEATGKDGAAPAAAPPTAAPESEDRLTWAIPQRQAYTMSADGFIPAGGAAHGLKGRCRYIFSGPPEDPETGRVECHDADGFKAVYLPLTCLKDLRPAP